jgi:hypothetical protein
VQTPRPIIYLERRQLQSLSGVWTPSVFYKKQGRRPRVGIESAGPHHERDGSDAKFQLPTWYGGQHFSALGMYSARLSDTLFIKQTFGKSKYP